ncbi:hypothetical protein JCM3774_003359 [Rhodotorula dairenensis]
MAGVQLEHVQWRAPEFLLALPNGQLADRAFALEYFSHSPFFDKQSSNAQLAMQVMFSRGSALHGVDLEPDLVRFTGVEFVVADALSSPPDLYVILKRNRSSPTHTTVLKAYHILNGNVYQAPTLFNVLNERLLTSTHALSTAFRALTDLKPAWTRERQYAWDIKPPTAASAAAAAVALDAKAPPPPQQPLPLDDDNDAGSGGDAQLGNDQPGASAAKEEEEEGRERPGDEFNPLLFRALQSVAARTEAEAIVAYQREQARNAARNDVGAEGPRRDVKMATPA